MKLPVGVTVHIDGHKYENEIPDDKCPAIFKEKLDAKPKKIGRKASSDNT